MYGDNSYRPFSDLAIGERFQFALVGTVFRKTDRTLAEGGLYGQMHFVHTNVQVILYRGTNITPDRRPDRRPDQDWRERQAELQ